MAADPLYEIVLFDRLAGWKMKRMSLCYCCTRECLGTYYINFIYRNHKERECFVCASRNGREYPYCAISKYHVGTALWVSDGNILFCSPECFAIVAGNDFFE